MRLIVFMIINCVRVRLAFIKLYLTDTIDAYLYYMDLMENTCFIVRVKCEKVYCSRHNLSFINLNKRANLN